MLKNKRREKKLINKNDLKKDKYNDIYKFKNGRRNNLNMINLFKGLRKNFK